MLKLIARKIGLVFMFNAMAFAAAALDMSGHDAVNVYLLALAAITTTELVLIEAMRSHS